ncbi:MAG: HAD family hydrolase [Longimicrobiales bacterium]|nr:HAD family hydrolase [Longimicrobiales bacterium]
MKRLLLFDIDGTLVRGGPAKIAFEEALLDTFDTTGPIEVHEFSGKTDPQIARELLRLAGLDDARIDAGMPALFRHYLAGLEARLPTTPVEVLPGVVPLIEALEVESGVALGLVTGNVIGGARLKLSGPGLEARFAIGGYGSDSEERNDLPAVALDRARAHFDVDFAPSDAVVIGDTPRDVICGRAHGLRTVAVATGDFSAGSLRAAGADEVVESFGDLAVSLDLLLAG